MPRDTQSPCEGSSWRDRQRVWTKLSSLGHLFLVSDHFVIAWGTRTTNLICQIIEFQGTCDPCCYYVLLLRPHVWKRLALLGAKLQEQAWEWGRALAPGTSLRLEVTLLAACLRGQQPESDSLSWLCLRYMWIKALLVTMRFLKTQIGNCSIWLDWKYSGLPNHFMANRWGNYGNSDRLYFFGLQDHCRWWLQPWNLKMLAPWKKSYDNPGAY